MCLGYQQFFKRLDCFLTRTCILNFLIFLIRFVYRTEKHSNSEKIFTINDGDRTEISSMLKYHDLKSFFPTYYVSEHACGSYSLFVLANN